MSDYGEQSKGGNEEPDVGEDIAFDQDTTNDVDAEEATIGRTVRTQPADPDIRGLHQRHKDGDLVLQPEFQRKYVWDATKASRLVESVLLDVPIPVIYLAEEDNGTDYVIDGQQRLTALFSFIDGRHPDGTVFSLRNMEVFTELQGLTYANLPSEYQHKLKRYPLRTVTILRDSDPDVKYRIFERLNTGSVPLNDMELRNCVYRGPYMDLLRQLAADDVFRRILGLSGSVKRMKDVELVLRFASFHHATYLRYDQPMKRFFNADMARYRNITDHDAQQLRTTFHRASLAVQTVFGTNAFRRYHAGHDKNPAGQWEPRWFNASLFDVQMGVLAEHDLNQVTRAADRIREAVVDLMVNNSRFIDAITMGSSDRTRVRDRFDIMRRTVDEVLADHPSQPRCFTRALKQELYDADPTCRICQQHIAILDDAAIDHIEQYWRGGQTIPTNARLTHRYCNATRPRRD